MEKDPHCRRPIIEIMDLEYSYLNGTVDQENSYYVGDNMDKL